MLTEILGDYIISWIHPQSLDCFDALQIVDVDDFFNLYEMLKKIYDK